VTEPNATNHRVSRRSVLKSSAASALALGALPALAPAASAAPPARSARLTWFSITNWLVEVGGTTLLIDGYISRVPGPPFFFGGGGGLARTQAPVTPDVAAIQRVFDAIGGRRIDYVLTSHSHFDHSFDTATWARLTGAPVIGSKTTAFQCIAQGIPASRCHVVNGGEVLDLGGGLTVRVIRTNHSGNASNPEQHLPVELSTVPTPDPVTGGLRVGVAEDFPNGGGGRAYLFTLDSGPHRLSWLYTSSLSAFDIDQPIVVDGVDFGAPIDNLAAAMADADLDSVDLWTGVGSTAVAERVLPVVRPRTYIPNHWDGLFNPFEPGLPFPYSDPALESMVVAEGIRLLPQRQYLDAFRIDAAGVRPMPNHAVKRRLGFADVQTFADARQTATLSRAAADHGDCCG
jgi:hypothetical protein